MPAGGTRGGAIKAPEARGAGSLRGASRAVTWLLRLYEIPVVLAAALYMLWVRLLPFEPFLGGKEAYYIGTDPYYHLRAVIATVANFPRTIRFDPFTQFPIGTGTGQFGSLFDILAALLALVMGGGNPDRHTIELAVGVFPAILGALLAVPFYFLARRLVGRVGALFATLAIALLPGEFLIRSVAGYADHHVAEALGMVLAILGVFAAIERSAAAGASLAKLRAWRSLRGPLVACALGALGVVFYFLVWPPALLVVGLFSLFYGVQYFVDHARKVDTGYLAFSGAITFGLAGLLLLPTAERFELNFNTFSYLQPLSCFLLAGGVLALEFASRALAARKLPAIVLPAGSLAAAAVAFFCVKTLAPSLYGSLYWGASWVTGIGVKRTTLTIAEAHGADTETFVGAYGYLIFVFYFALLLAAGLYAWRRRRSDLLLLLWGAITLLAAYTQVRFTYYLALTVAVAFGYVASVVAEYTGLNAGLRKVLFREESRAKAPKGRRAKAGPALGAHQFVVLGLVALFIVPVNLMETEAGLPGWSLKGMGPDQNLQLWTRELHWLEANTPHVGVKLETIYERPTPGARFSYPPGSYGVLSWWDYGHWIEVVGERPPVANPFQQQAPFASCFFTAADEARAEGFVAAYQAGRFRRDGDVACERAPVPEVEGDPGNPIRYVMIDDEMAAGKFGAMAVWAGWSSHFAQDRHQREFDFPGHGRVKMYTAGGEYDATMTARLYFDDARELHHYRLVHETSTFALIGNIVQFSDEGYRIPSGGFHTILTRRGFDPAEPDYDRNHPERLSGDSFGYDLRQAASVKTFEHVAGAHLVGNATPGATVSAAVRMKSSVGREFVYQASTTAGADGRFDLVVPYSTSGYLAPEQGGTNLAVLAQGKYEVVEGDPATSARFALDVDVPERAVLDGGVVPVTLAGG